MFVLKYHPRAVKRIKTFHSYDQKKVITKLLLLQNDPFQRSLNIRKLVNTANSYRMRVGNIRIIFEPDLKNRTIFVEDIDYRGNIYQ